MNQMWPGGLEEEVTVQHPASDSSGERHNQLQFKHANLLSWARSTPPFQFLICTRTQCYKLQSPIKKTVQFISSRERSVPKNPSQKHWTKWQNCPIPHSRLKHHSGLFCSLCKAAGRKQALSLQSSPVLVEWGSVVKASSPAWRNSNPCL